MLAAPTKRLQSGEIQPPTAELARDRDCRIYARRIGYGLQSSRELLGFALFRRLRHGRFAFLRNSSSARVDEEKLLRRSIARFSVKGFTW
jgi:hypothetical protein